MAGQCCFRRTLWSFIIGDRQNSRGAPKNVLILLTICKSWMKSWDDSSQSVEVDYLPGKLRSPKGNGFAQELVK